MTQATLLSKPTAAGPLPTTLTLVAVLLLFVVPAPLLDVAGINYGTPSGAPWEKVHPGTDLIALAVVLAACRTGNPLSYLAARLRRFPGAAVLLAAVAFLVLYFVKIQQAPFTPAIDTFVMPPLLFFLLVDLSEKGKATIEIGLHVFLFVNAILGIVEFLSGWRLIPLSLNGLILTSEMEWRASGLLGHPLASSAMAGLYAVIIALGCGRALPKPARGPAMIFQLTALGAFGGRTALVLTAVSLAGVLAVKATGLLAGHRFDIRTLGFGLLMAPLFVVALFLVVGGGFFDQMFHRFVEDNGSAQSRAVILNLFSYLSWQDIVFGPNQNHVASLQHLEGIEVGVESFWFGLVLQCGLWLATLFFIALGAFMVHVMQQSDRRAIVPLVFFTLIISSSVSLSAKSTSLGQFIVLVMILMPAPARQPAQRSLQMTRATLVEA